MSLSLLRSPAHSWLILPFWTVLFLSGAAKAAPIAISSLAINEITVSYDGGSTYGTANILFSGPLPGGDYYQLAPLSAHAGSVGVGVRTRIESDGTTLTLGICPQGIHCKPVGKLNGVFDIDFVLGTSLARNEEFWVNGEFVSSAFSNYANPQVGVLGLQLGDGTSPYRPVSDSEMIREGPLSSIMLHAVANI